MEVESKIKCPHQDCEVWEKCNIIKTEIQYEYAKKTRFRCVDCGKISCFYCGDLLYGLCDDCIEERMQ